MDRWRSPYYRTGVAAFILASCSAVALAQDGGLQATLDVAQELNWSDNPEFETGNPESEAQLRTNLSFGLSSTTAVQSVGLQVGGALEFGQGDGDDGFTDPFANLTFARDTGNSTLNASLRYRESDVDGSLLLLDEFDNIDLVSDPGTRADTNLQLGFETGKNASFGVSGEAFLITRDFQNTADPDLTDSERVGGELALRFDLSRVMTATLSTAFEDFDVDGTDSDREERIVDASLAYDISPSLTATARLGFATTDVITPQTVGPDLVRTEEGLGFGFGLTQEVSNGSWRLALDSDVRSNGRRSQATLRRAFILPDGGLAISVGATKSEDQSTNALFGMDYSRDFPTGRLTVALNQNVSTNSDTQETLNTSLNVSYNQQINSVSSWQAGLSLADSNVLGSDIDDRLRVNFNTSYRHELGSEWGLVGGYRHSNLDTEDGNDASSNTVFLRLEKQFAWAP